jgi:hypothetical protein
VHYLELYHHCAGPLLSDRFGHELLSRITLQMAHAEPAVRHALIAVAYLNRQQTGSLEHAACANFTDDDKNKTLLVHYNKSLRLLVIPAMESSYSSEVGLVTCLLFVCIEFLRADNHTAFTHLRNGLKITTDIQHQSGSPRQIPWTEPNQTHVHSWDGFSLRNRRHSCLVIHCHTLSLSHHPL